MEALAAESQALVDKAMTMARANALTTDAVTARRAPMVHDAGSYARRPTDTGTPATGTGDTDRPVAGDGPEVTARPVRVSPSPVASVATAEPTSQPTPPTVTDQEDAAGADTVPRDEL